MLTDEIRIKPFHYSNKRFSLKILNKGRLNSQKQIIAFMPNLVHSLDAASLALLLTSFFKEIEDVKNIYTIHDCFAVTANNMDNLINMLKLTYIKIYSEEMYILKLDKGIRDNIKNVYGDNALNDETLQINVSSFTSPLYFPDVNIVLGKKIEFDFKSLKKSSYIIN
jgi:DNA-directed RNA polymerase